MAVLILRGLEPWNYFPMSKGLKSSWLMKENVSSQLAGEHHVLTPAGPRAIFGNFQKEVT